MFGLGRRTTDIVRVWRGETFDTWIVEDDGTFRRIGVKEDTETYDRFRDIGTAAFSALTHSGIRVESSTLDLTGDRNDPVVVG